MSDVHPATPLGSPPPEPPISPFVLEHVRKLHAEAAAIRLGKPAMEPGQPAPPSCPVCRDLPQSPHGVPAQPEAATPECWMPCDPDCEIGPSHCWNWHRPNHKPDWHDPRECCIADVSPEAATPGRTEQIGIIVTRFGGVFAVGRTENRVYVGGYEMRVTEARKLAAKVATACAGAEEWQEARDE